MRNALDVFVAAHWTTLAVAGSAVLFVCLSVGFCVWIWRDAQAQIEEAMTDEDAGDGGGYESPIFDEQTGEPLNAKAAKLLGRDHKDPKYRSSRG